jgi:hypothetical protein
MEIQKITKKLNFIFVTASFLFQAAAFYFYNFLEEYDKGNMALLYGILCFIFVIANNTHKK